MPQGNQSVPRSSTKDQRLGSDLVELLVQDHRTIEQLFDEYLEREDPEKEELVEQLFKALDIHAQLEEEIFYPALKELGDPSELASLEQGDEEQIDKIFADVGEEGGTEQEVDDESTEEVAEDVILNAYEDHHMMKDVIGRMRDMEKSSSEFRHTMTELQELVYEHVAEEEDVMFAEARLKLDTQALGARVLERKQDLLKEAS